jgi:5-formyltetrahydrofolate cyclo-ligase
MDEKIKRINELYHLSQERALTDEEKDEQNKLRRDYIDSIKSGLKAQLNNISIVEKDGSVTSLKR